MGARRPAHGRGREADDYNVGGADELGKPLLSLLCLEVERHQSLARAEGLGRFGSPPVLRPRTARACRPLDGGDFGSEVGEVGARERSRQVRSNLQNVQAVERQHIEKRFPVDVRTQDRGMPRPFTPHTLASGRPVALALILSRSVVGRIRAVSVPSHNA